MANGWQIVELSQVMKLDPTKVPLDAGTDYPMVGVYSFGRGLFLKEPVSGNNTSYKVFYRLKAEHVVMSQLFGWEGALALSSEKFADLYVSPQIPTFI
jgi:type I restriction enzyme S subunit